MNCYEVAVGCGCPCPTGCSQTWLARGAARGPLLPVYLAHHGLDVDGGRSDGCFGPLLLFLFPHRDGMDSQAPVPRVLLQLCLAAVETTDITVGQIPHYLTCGLITHYPVGPVKSTVLRVGDTHYPVGPVRSTVLRVGDTHSHNDEHLYAFTHEKYEKNK